MYTPDSLPACSSIIPTPNIQSTTGHAWVPNAHAHEVLSIEPVNRLSRFALVTETG